MVGKNENIKRVQELIGDEKLNTVIESIIDKVYEHKCFIMIHPTRVSSGHKPTPLDCCIILGADPTRDKLHILWDIFHEYGHHLDEKNLAKLTPGQKQTREKYAWRVADEEFLKAGDLEAYKENYVLYRNSCLSTYEIFDFSGPV